MSGFSQRKHNGILIMDEIDKFPSEAEKPKPVQYAAMSGVSRVDIFMVVAIFYHEENNPLRRMPGTSYKKAVRSKPKFRYEIVKCGIRSRNDALGVANTLNKMNGLPLWSENHIKRPTRKNLAKW